jgi:hypothetical protein
MSWAARGSSSSRRIPKLPWLLCDEILGLGVMADDRGRCLFWLVLKTGLGSDFYAEPLGAEKIGDGQVVL